MEIPSHCFVCFHSSMRQIWVSNGKVGKGISGGALKQDGECVYGI